MRASSSVISIGTHVALAALVLIGPVRAPRTPQTPIDIIVYPAPPSRAAAEEDDAISIHVPDPVAESGLILPPDQVPVIVVLPTHIAPAPRWISAPTVSAEPGRSGQGNAGHRLLGEGIPAVLAGPLPRYPELLRQAGIEGRVVLDAVIDTNGRAERASLSVVFATNPAFVRGAQEALLATLFRPATANGRAIRVTVRRSYEFTLRGGTVRAP